MSELYEEPDHSQWDISSSNESWRSIAPGRQELRVFRSPLEEVHFERWAPNAEGDSLVIDIKYIYTL